MIEQMAPPTPWTALYQTTRWRKFSILFRRMHPICAECERRGQTFEATLVHHLVEYRPGMSQQEFWIGPFESLCLKHHLETHGWSMRDFKTDIDESGYPRDPAHPFNVASDKQERRT
jgi:5-methylcytosine-specific restriction enzyme A